MNENYKLQADPIGEVVFNGITYIPKPEPMTTNDWREEFKRLSALEDHKGGWCFPYEGINETKCMDWIEENFVPKTEIATAEEGVLGRVREWAKEKAYDISIKTVENPHWIVDLDDVLLFLSSLTNNSSKDNHN